MSETKNPVPPCRPDGRLRAAHVAVLLFLGAFAIRAPLLDGLALWSDPIEYLNIARNVALGRGLVASIKWSFYVPHQPVVHSALGSRPVLFPILAAPLVAAFSHSSPFAMAAAVRTFNALLGSLAVALAYLLFRRLYSATVAVLAAALLAAYPGFLRCSTDPLTEPLCMVLTLVALLAYGRGKARWLFAAGAATGLAYLARPAGVLLLPVLCGHAAVEALRTGSGKGLRLAAASLAKRVGPLLVGFALAASPFWWATYRVYGSPFHSDLACDYSVLTIQDVTWRGYGKRFPTPLGFVRGHFRDVAARAAAQTADFTATLGDALGPLAVFLLFVRRRHLGGVRGVTLAFAALNYVVYCLSWTLWGDYRYMLPTYLFLAPLALGVLDELALPSLRVSRARLSALALVFALVGASYAARDATLVRGRLQLRRTDSWQYAYRRAADWLRSRQGYPNLVVASNNPWMLNLLADVPAVICPVLDKRELMRPFLAEHNVEYVVIFGRGYNQREAELEGSRALLPIPLAEGCFRVWRRCDPARGPAGDAASSRQRAETPRALPPRGRLGTS